MKKKKYHTHKKKYYKEITNLEVKEKVKIMEKNGLGKLVTEGNAKLRGKLKRKRKMRKSPRRQRKKKSEGGLLKNEEKRKKDRKLEETQNKRKERKEGKGKRKQAIANTDG